MEVTTKYMQTKTIQQHPTSKTNSNRLKATEPQQLDNLAKHENS